MSKPKPALQCQYAALLVDMVCTDEEQKLELLQRAGIRPALLSSQDAFLNEDQLIGLVHSATQHQSNPALGINFGERLNLMTHGALGQAVLSCNTLEQALNLLLKYYRTRMLSVQMELTFHQGMAILSLECDISDSLTQRFMIETIFTCIVRINMFFFGMKLMTQGQVHVSYPKPEHLAAYQHTFFDGIHFSCPDNSLQFKTELLTLPMAMPNPSALKQAEEACTKILARLPKQQSLTEQINALIFEEQRGFSSLEDMASMLHMSGRTLRRKLAELNTSYRQLTDQIKLSKAKKSLLAGDSVEDIAEQLGYSDPSNFGRAFRKQAGMPPSEYKKTIN